MSETTFFARADSVVLDIKAEFPENIICEATVAVPDPSVTGQIGPLSESTETEETE